MSILRGGTFRKKENQSRAPFSGSLQSRGGTYTDHSFYLPGYPRRPEDEAYDEDGNPLQYFYDSDPPGVGSPASALRDAYALYYPAEKRYHPRGLRYGPGLRWREGQGGGPPNRLFFIKPLKPLFSLSGTHESDRKLVAGRSVWP